MTKVQYERLPFLFTERRLWVQIALSLVLNWIIGPFMMLAIAWATLPDLPDYRTGVILVGLARCIAMVIIWNQLAGGDHNYCAILVAINSILQIVLYAPFAVWFINIISGEEDFALQYGTVAIDVLIVRRSPLSAWSSLTPRWRGLLCSTWASRSQPASSHAMRCGSSRPKTFSSASSCLTLARSRSSACSTPSLSCSRSKARASSTTSARSSGRSCPWSSTFASCGPRPFSSSGSSPGGARSCSTTRWPFCSPSRPAQTTLSVFPFSVPFLGTAPGP